MATAAPSVPERRTLALHGHRVTYVEAGHADTPLVVLIHGITSAADTWRRVVVPLSEQHRVVAPDLLGHGLSAKPRGDYSLGAYASGLRDLLLALGHERATLVGHSLGGGVAMQLAYQFPDICERLVLVSSGGLGRAVHPALRAAALPGADWVLPLLTPSRLGAPGSQLAGVLDRLGVRAARQLSEVVRGYASLADAQARAAFLHTIRAVIDVDGQRVSARDRLYLSAALPTMIVWGARDRIIPVRHGERAHTEMPGSRLEVFEEAGHFPHLDEPARFVEVLSEFVASTEPARPDPEELRKLLLEGPPRKEADVSRRAASHA
jgi:pimeloyl-ACP methyl ester carboxylesterase